MADKKKPMSQTKLKMCIAGLLFSFAGFVLIYFFPALADVYSTYVSSILGIIGFYSGANIGQEWIARKMPTPPVPSNPQTNEDPNLTKGD